MTTPLPTFRALALAAAAAHVAAMPADGYGLRLSDLASATPVRDITILEWIQSAQTSISGALAALSGLSGVEAAERAELCLVAWAAAHVALMAYYGVEVAS